MLDNQLQLHRCFTKANALGERGCCVGDLSVGIRRGWPQDPDERPDRGGRTPDGLPGSQSTGDGGSRESIRGSVG